MNDDRLWYFAYGSNLEHHTFFERRNMQPSAQRTCRLDGYRLCFDLPVGPGERGVANLSPDQAGSVWGVAFELSPGECERLDESEGVGLDLYQRIAVTVVDQKEAALEAFAYISRHRDPRRKPSQRYLGLILKGAQEHQLPAAYRTFLADFELAVDERDSQPTD